MKLSIIALVIFSFAMSQPLQIVVKTGSMEPNLQIDDLLLIDETYYSTNPIQRFDVVVFQRPMEDFKRVARIIATGGETIAIKKNQIFINGKSLKEPFKTHPCSDKHEDGFLPCGNFDAYKVPEEEYFLLGDNRGDSEDSRLWKPRTIKRDKILGKVIQIIPKRKRV